MKMMKKRTSLLVACTLALCTVPAAFAGKDGDKHFKMMDANGDGKVTREEHATATKKMFTECDANRDGIVTVAEMETAMANKADKPAQGEKSVAEKIKMIDQDGDGQLTAAEHDAGSDKMFAKMDTDGDGTLSKEECAEGMKMKKKHT